jgi:NitT/TauT family transport system ATP-binding protein
MMFQDYGRSLFPWLSVESHLRTALGSELEPRDRRLRIEDALEITGLSEYRKLLPRQLSGGMQQRLALARAIVLRPEVLLLDEPFGSLDQLLRYELEDHFLRLLQNLDFSAIVVTHDLDEAIYLGDRVLALSKQPTTIIIDWEINLARPRSQLETRSQPEFLNTRRILYDNLTRSF